MSKIRVPALGLREGLIELDEETSRYVVKVHRRSRGELIEVFDPHQGVVGGGVIVSDRLPRLSVHVDQVSAAPDQEMPVTLAVAVAKSEKPEQAMRDVTALGATRLVLLQGERSVARPDPSTRSDRLLRVGEQVARQCGRARLPEVSGPMALDQFLGGTEASELKLICAFHETSRPLLTYTSAIKAASGVVVLVGPEGGFSPTELQMCLDAGCQAVDLGPYVLRAEVAVAAVLSTLRALFLV